MRSGVCVCAFQYFHLRTVLGLSSGSHVAQPQQFDRVRHPTPVHTSPACRSFEVFSGQSWSIAVLGFNCSGRTFLGKASVLRILQSPLQDGTSQVLIRKQPRRAQRPRRGCGKFVHDSEPGASTAHGDRALKRFQKKYHPGAFSEGQGWYCIVAGGRLTWLWSAAGACQALKLISIGRS